MNNKVIDNTRKIGKWEKKQKRLTDPESGETADWSVWHCSKCNRPQVFPSNYCPYCGARMYKEMS